MNQKNLGLKLAELERTGQLGKPLSVPDAKDHDRGSLRFICTSTSMREQYDVYRGTERVGYVHSRRSGFTVWYPGIDGVCLHDGTNDGYGGFTEAERDQCLDLAASLILNELNRA